jgi:hypothetical protein
MWKRIQIKIFVKTTMQMKVTRMRRVGRVGAAAASRKWAMQQK